MDPRNRKLAKQLIEYSVKLQPGEKIYIEIKGLHATELGTCLVTAATEAATAALEEARAEVWRAKALEAAQKEQAL